MQLAKITLLTLAGLTITLAAQSQTFMGNLTMPGGGTRQLIKPADSSSGTATAGPSIVIPDGICTSSNSNCYNPIANKPPVTVAAGGFCGLGQSFLRNDGGSYSSGSINTVISCAGGSPVGGEFTCPASFMQVDLGETYLANPYGTGLATFKNTSCIKS